MLTLPKPLFRIGAAPVNSLYSGISSDEAPWEWFDSGNISVTRILHLHVGAGKTGTSALQAAFVRNRDWLAGHGIDYPPSPWDEAAANHKITSGNGMGLAKFLNPAHRFHPTVQPDDVFQQTLCTILNSR